MRCIARGFAFFLSMLLTFNNALPFPLRLVQRLAENYADSYTQREAAPMLLSRYTEKEYPLVTDADFYVSPDGDDANDGSFASPFATPERARDAVRSLDKTERSGITVAFRAGEYRVSALEFTAEDSGTESCPITYCAYGDGEVIFNGGVSLRAEDFRKVTDEAMLSRLSEQAREKVVCTDLGALGVTAAQYGKIHAIGAYHTADNYDGDYVGSLYCELFVNDKRQQLARYPDTGFLATGKVLRQGLSETGDAELQERDEIGTRRNLPGDTYAIDKKLAKRLAGWKTLDDVWMFGFWMYDWADASTPIGAFDPDKKELTTKFVSRYGAKKDAPYYFFNVFEELDCPGEWYLDRESGLLYLYPDGDLSAAQIDLTLTTQPILRVRPANCLTFKKLTFKGTRGNAAEISGNSNTVTRCTVKNIAGNAVSVYGYRNLVSENEITRTGKGGILLNGGDVRSLTPGENKADNNYIHDWSEIYQTYQPAVTLSGVGNICSHNEMCNSPHEAVTYSGNNHLIEYNNIHDVCLLSDDAGAIYAGRHWNFYGNVIRYNAVYDLGADGHRPDGIYMDDALSGQTIYGNILVNVPKIGIHLGGGRDLNVRNNIIINSNDRSVSYDSRAIDGVFGGWFADHSKKGADMWQWLYDSPWQTETWKAAFPQMAKIRDDFDRTDDPDFAPNPAYSVVSGNLIVNLTDSIGNISEAANRYSTVENNAVFGLYRSKRIFNDPENGDYTLKADAPVYTVLPEFEQIPLSQIGQY